MMISSLLGTRLFLLLLASGSYMDALLLPKGMLGPSPQRVNSPGSHRSATFDSQVSEETTSSPRFSPWDINPSIPNKIASIDQIMESGKTHQVLHQAAATNRFQGGRDVLVGDDALVNFGSCSYLGLETHEKVVEATCVATELYGSQFSSSRAYLSHALYETLESLLSDIYQKPVMVAPSTSLGHIAAIPVLVGDNDAVIIDMQVHASVQTAAELLKPRGIPLSVIPHNDMISLEKSVKNLRSNPRIKNIWYLADGVYSMYGDFADFSTLQHLLDKYPNFHLYIDDAHGASWTGKYGCGVVRSQMDHHDRMVLAVSLNKSFAAAGGAIVFASMDQLSLVRNCGGPMIFSGPIQPPMLGAACASARLHLSEEILDRQSHLADLINYCDEAIEALGLPQCSRNKSPIFFIPVGKPQPIFDLVERVKNDGFYINSATYPAVPMRRGGLRIVVNSHLSKDDIDNLLRSVRRHYGSCLLRHGITMQDISSNFKISPALLDRLFDDSLTSSEKKNGVPHDSLKIELFRTIHDVNKIEWDQFFYGKGNLDSESLAMVEQVFDGSVSLPENKWDPYYFVVRDANNFVIAAAYFTSVLIKDDMLSSSQKSEKIEQLRTERNDPYYLCSRAVMLGNPVSGGLHLYLNRMAPGWKDAVRHLTREMEKVQLETNSNQIMLRGLGQHDSELENVLLSSGFSMMNFMDQYVLDSLSKDENFIMTRIKSKARVDLRKQVLKHLDNFRLEVSSPSTLDEIKQCYDLYQLVHARAKVINAFKLPIQYFEAMTTSPRHEFLRVYKKGCDEAPIAMMCSNLQGSNYGAEIIGFEKGGGGEGVNVYLLTLYFAIQRAAELGFARIDLGYTSELSKKKLGAVPIKQNMYVQLTDFFNQAELAAK